MNDTLTTAPAGAQPLRPAPQAPNPVAFSCAVFHARQALLWRSRKRRSYGASLGRCEAMARQHEGKVREYGLQAEIALQRADDACETVPAQGRA